MRIENEIETSASSTVHLHSVQNTETLSILEDQDSETNSITIVETSPRKINNKDSLGLGSESHLHVASLPK